MANVSAFSGTLIFKTNKNPWTSEGFLYLYEVLTKSFCSYGGGCGGYGVCLNDIEDSSDFLVTMLKQSSEEPSIYFWGNGRWSAYSTFEYFDTWSKHPSIEESLKPHYNETRQRLLKLMYENEWLLEFEYVDEEYGTGFISEELTIIYASQEEEELKFYTDRRQYNYMAHTLENYCTFIEGMDLKTCEMFYNRYYDILPYLKIQTEEEEKLLENYMLEEGHKYIGVYSHIGILEDIPLEFLEGWEEYKKNKEG